MRFFHRNIIRPRNTNGGKVYRKRTESTIVTACLNYLQTLYNQGKIRWFSRQNVGKTGKVRLCRIKGTADIQVILNDGNNIWVECKLRNYKITPFQAEFKLAMEKVGHFYWVILSVEELSEKICKVIQI